MYRNIRCDVFFYVYGVYGVESKQSLGRTVLPRAALQAALYKTVRMVGGTVSRHDRSLFKHGHPSLTQEA